MTKKTKNKNCRKEEREIQQQLVKLDRYIRWLESQNLSAKSSDQQIKILWQLDRSRSQITYWKTKLENLWSGK